MESNVQKMRKTLLVVRDALDTISAHEDDIEFVRVWIAQTKDAVQEALAAPPKPLRNCDIYSWRNAWAKWRTEKHSKKPETYKEVYDGTASFMDWFMGFAEAKGADNVQQA